MASLPVLTFHSLDDLSSVISFSPELFRRGLARLKSEGYQSISLLEAASLVRSGLPIPQKRVVITFDDGYENVHSEALPFLREHNMTATVFITIGEGNGDRLTSLEGRSMLSWNQIRDLRDCGVEIGCHTLTHPDLTKLSRDQIVIELCDAKKGIEDRLGNRVSSFAYPFGRYDERSRDVAQQHFECACSDFLGMVTESSDLYAMERIDSYYLRKESAFDLMSTDLFPAYIRLRNIPRRLRRALKGRS
jgi:peptidoglycan/xylan/chitin deacetylase (PgdA/CDA1 family)